MKNKFSNNTINQYTNSNTFYQQQEQLSALKMRFALKQQKKQFQRRLYGEHYNYSKVGLNKQKKYMLEEQRNTQIERSNRILLQKIQRIAKRSVPNIIKKRAITEDSYQQILNSEEKPSFNHSRVIPHFKKSSLQETQLNFHKIHLNDQKTMISPRKHIFKINFKFNGKLFDAKAYVESNKFVLCLQAGKMSQKLKIDLENYKQFYKNVLNRNHQNILDYLKYNGTIFELKSELQQKISLEQEQYIYLPILQNKNQNRNKYYPDKPQSLLQSSLNF